MSNTIHLMGETNATNSKLKVENKVETPDLILSIKSTPNFDEEGTQLLSNLRKRLNETGLYQNILKSCKIHLESSEWMNDLKKNIHSVYKVNKPLFESGINEVTSTVLPYAFETLPEQTLNLATSKIRRVLRKTLQVQSSIADESENLTASMSEYSGDNLVDGDETEVENEQVIENEETEIEDQLNSYSASISDTSSSTSELYENEIEDEKLNENLETSEDSRSGSDDDTF